MSTKGKRTIGRQRWTALAVSLVLALSLALPAAAAETAEPLLPAVRTYGGQFTDLEDSWCREEAIAVYETGLMNGKSDTRFDIQGSLTYAQITVIAARLHNLLSGGDGDLGDAAQNEPWYQPAVDYLTAHLEEGDGDAAAYVLTDLSWLDSFADVSCDRYDFVWYLAAVLPEEALTPINDISSLPDETDNDILSFYRAGILTGSDSKGTFNGQDTINRGQAAAILARITDPARRVSFTLASPNYTEEVLGLEPDTVILSVDGYDITAELYFYMLANNIMYMKAEQAYSYYETYEEYYEAYWADSDFTGSFADYLQEKYGIDADAPIDWDTPDRGGMSPAQKVLQDTLDNIKMIAVLMAHQAEYPLTDEQEAEITEYLSHWGVPYGFSQTFLEEMLTITHLSENMMVQYPITDSELTELLESEGYLYGQYVIIYRGDYSSYESDAAAKATAEEVRQKLLPHLDDPEYVEFLVWKYSEDFASSPDLIPLDLLSEENQQTLKKMSPGRVSPVLTEEGAYLVVVKLDPSENADLMESVSALAASAKLTQWAQDAQVTTSAAYESLDVAAIDQALEALDF